jgi:predicted small metal-binding protein
MGLKIKCSDIESAQGLKPSCPYVAQGENMEELMADLGKHAKKVHAYTDEMLQAPETVALIKATVIKE